MWWHHDAHLYPVSLGPSGDVAFHADLEPVVAELEQRRST
jgi:hypothetical protein